MDKIICLGKNYSEHAKEMGEVLPEKPVIFLKPPSTLKSASNRGDRLELSFPKDRGQVHHECEIVLRIGAQKQIEAVTLGLDMTLRDVQSDLKKKGQPWTISKVFTHSAVVGPWIETSHFPHWEKTEFQFSLNGQLKQKGSAQEMILKVPDISSYIESFFPLSPGDLIFTGTPAGVGAVNLGNTGKLEWGPIDYEVSWK